MKTTRSHINNSCTVASGLLDLDEGVRTPSYRSSRGALVDSSAPSFGRSHRLVRKWLDNQSLPPALPHPAAAVPKSTNQRMLPVVLPLAPTSTHQTMLPVGGLASDRAAGSSQTSECNQVVPNRFKLRSLGHPDRMDCTVCTKK